jgi:DNA-binding NarL/FixJ family response regulator
MATRILLADGKDFMRKSIRRLIEEKPGLQICAEAADGAEAVEKAREVCPDIALLDIVLPKLNGIEAAKSILKTCPNTLVLAESLHAPKELYPQLMEYGVRGFVVKDRLASDLIPAIETLLNGGTWFYLYETH